MTNPADAELRCATHPDRRGTGTCSRCGDYYCTECVGDAFDRAQPRCVKCGGAPQHIPWEDDTAAATVRWYRTVARVLLKTADTARRLPRDRPARPAIVFSAITMAFAVLAIAPQQYLVFWSEAAFSEAPRSNLILATLARLALYALVWVGAVVGIPAVLVLAARVFGLPSTPYRVALRWICYGTGALAIAPIPLAGMAAPFFTVALLFDTMRGDAPTSRSGPVFAVGLACGGYAVLVYCVFRVFVWQ